MPFKARDFMVLRLVLAISAFLVGGGFCVGPEKWHQSANFYFINFLAEHTTAHFLGWPVYGVLLILAGLCLVSKRLRPVGYLIGGIIYTFFALAVWLAWPTGHLASIFAPCNLTTVATLYWSSLRWSIYEQLDPERKAVRG